MSIDTIAARNRRIEKLEAQRRDDAATIKGLVKRIEQLEDDLHIQHECRKQQEARAEAAEAKVEELERLLDDAEALIRRQRNERKALAEVIAEDRGAMNADIEAAEDKLARAEKLAEAVDEIREALSDIVMWADAHPDNPARSVVKTKYIKRGDEVLRAEALAAFRSPGPATIWEDVWNTYDEPEGEGED